MAQRLANTYIKMFMTELPLLISVIKDSFYITIYIMGEGSWIIASYYTEDQMHTGLLLKFCKRQIIKNL
jgi:hypothetical protein